MDMERLIARINALARKAKTEGLTENELNEQDVLRKEYLAVFKANLMAQLDNTYIVDPDGTKRKLKN